MSKAVCKSTNNPAFKSGSLHEYGMLLRSITLAEEEEEEEEEKDVLFIQRLSVAQGRFTFYFTIDLYAYTNITVTLNETHVK